MFRKTPVLRVLLIVLLAYAVFSVTGCRKAAEQEPGQAVTEAPQLPEATAEPEATEVPEETAEPEATEEPEATAEPGTEEAPEAAEEPGAGVTFAAGYVRVVSPTKSGWLPLPEEEDYVYTLRQFWDDGTESVNVIHVTPAGVYMESSTCENHDCIYQGEVTLDNISSRILGNMIICLPNQVYLELYSTEELLGTAGE